MHRGVTLIEICVVFAIIGILAGMILPAVSMIRKSAQKEKGTVATSDAWKTSENKTPSGPVDTFIITDPTNNQKWLCVKRGSSVSIIPYVPLEIKAEN